MNWRSVECRAILVVAVAMGGCSSQAPSERSGSSGGSGTSAGLGLGQMGGSAGGVISLEGGIAPNGSGADDPQSCAEAVNSHSYVGCEFWPTVTANPVWVEF